MLEKVRLGKTNLMVTRVSMGCIPIQRLSNDDAVKLVRQAYDLGVNFFDTARAYTNSEERLGQAFANGLRQKVIIATKSMSDSYEKTVADMEESLRNLQTDYIDIYQWHNPENMDDFQNSGPYRAMLEAQKSGKIRFIGITNHHLGRARQAINSGAFATLQYPFSLLSSSDELALSHECVEHDMGVIGMKGMCGGLLDDGRLPFMFLNQYKHIVPIWGVEKLSELRQFIDMALADEPLTAEMHAELEILRKKYEDEFCRGCGYCMPCTAGINLPLMMRIVLMANRTALGSQFNDKTMAQVKNIDNCTKCGNCVSACPYHLDVPELLKQQQTEYFHLYEAFHAKTV